MIARRHEMPFGAALKDGGGVRFRLWAPDCKGVELEWQNERRAMTAEADGWFTLDVAEAGPGDRYGFHANGQSVPDPASRFQPDDVHGLSQIVDPAAYRWRDGSWRGRPWDEAVISEIHIGAFTPEGTFEAAIPHLDHLARTGITGIEIMPVADWPGRRNWGYDGVFPFAPDAALGGPDGFKALIEAAHDRELMVLLDVVYNHFGPEGNYLGLYAQRFFTPRYRTPWGQAINFEDVGTRAVREFFIHNALYWIEEFGLDGLRFDAVHAIYDRSDPDILTELAQRVRAGIGDTRHVHLILENDHNQSRYLSRAGSGRPPLYTAQWNDDAHHAFHVLMTGEGGGYYSDYQEAPAHALGRALAEGFVYQGEPSPFRDGDARGEPSADLPPCAFVNFLQNHDQIGNRALGERLESLALPNATEAALAVLLLAPQVPMLFMGEEWGTLRPFQFFCDFHDELAQAVRDGRRKEFASFPEFGTDEARDRIPDPNARATFEASRLDWSEPSRARHRDRLALVIELLALRRRSVVPLIAQLSGGNGTFIDFGPHGVLVEWRVGRDVRLRLTANLGAAAVSDPIARWHEHILYSTPGAANRANAGDDLPPWSVVWELGSPSLQAHLD